MVRAITDIMLGIVGCCILVLFGVVALWLFVILVCVGIFMFVLNDIKGD